MFESGVEGLGGRILREAKDVAAPDAGQPAGPRDEQEAQRAHAPHDVSVRALARATPRFGDRVELKAACDVVGEDAQLLPRAVGPVVAGRHDVEGKLALEFRERLLLRAAAPDERVERRERQGHVGGDGVVLEVPVVRREQIQLEVLRTLVATCLR